MDPIEAQLKQLVKLMKAAKVDYAILGGMAVSVYGEPRMTFDIDVTIILDANKLAIDRFLKEARKFGFIPLPPNIKSFIKGTGVMPMRFKKNKVIGRCDFIIAENILEYLCIKRSIPKKIYSTTIKLITAEDLYIHKITSQRPRDIEDAKGIMRRQGRKLDTKYIDYWLKKIAKANKKIK